MKTILSRPGVALALLTAAALALAACSSAAPAPAQSDQSPPQQSGAAQPSEPEAVASGEAPDGSGISPILATTLLRTGTQRVSFLLTTPDALVKAPEVTVTTAFLGQGEAPGETVQAGFRLWPYAIRGAYDTQLTFPSPGPGGWTSPSMMQRSWEPPLCRWKWPTPSSCPTTAPSRQPARPRPWPARGP